LNYYSVGKSASKAESNVWSGCLGLSARTSEFGRLAVESGAVNLSIVAMLGTRFLMISPFARPLLSFTISVPLNRVKRIAERTIRLRVYPSFLSGVNRASCVLLCRSAFVSPGFHPKNPCAFVG